MNEIRKSFSGEPEKANAQRDIGLINRYALRELSPDEVFTFNATLCDDQIDRDLEAFSVLSLKRLQSLFVGKPLIVDHEWSSKNQSGRVYKTMLVSDGHVNRLRASIYMVKTPGMEETIKQIEGGILREVSIGFRCKRRACSVCGKDMRYDYMTGKVKCEDGHVRGDTVNGKMVHSVLEDPEDAFEVSLVAVPAQREAGITKSAARKKEISDDEWSERRKIFESTLKGKISDDIWAAVKAGKVSAAEVAAAHKKQQESVKKYYPDYVPEDDFCEGSIRYVIIPDTVIDKRANIASYRALGFCRKELKLQPIRISWFAADQDARRLGLNPSSLKSFYDSPELAGTASRKNPNLIFIRYPRDSADLMKTIFHECWHTFQMKDEWHPMDEDTAYWYMEDAFKRYVALSEDEKERLFFDELLMKDYRNT